MPKIVTVLFFAALTGFALVLLSGKGIGLLMLVAIFLSNLPESLSSIDALKKEGFSVICGPRR